MPSVWWDSACSLLVGAEVLDKFSGNTLVEMKSGGPLTPQLWERMSVAKVSCMLRAMATECLLKALWLKHGGTLTKDGKYVGLLKDKEHRLDALANALSKKGQVSFTTHELKLLEQASFWITSGRYPIQKDFQYLVPFRRPDGTLAPAQFWKGNPVQELRLLINKLQTALDIKMKFES